MSPFCAASVVKFTIWVFSTSAFGIDTTTFLIVRTWVTSSVFRTMSPVVAPISTRSPIRNAPV